MRRRSGAALCLLALVFAGDAFALAHGQYRVSNRELSDIVRAGNAPDLGVDASRIEVSTTTVALSGPPVVTVPSGPADPPPAPDPPPLPLRPARLDADFPDPSIVWGGDRWYAFATGSDGRNVQVSSSPDLLQWTAPTEAVPTLPSWAGPGYTWAPTVARIGNQWMLYVSIAGPFSQCIDRLVSGTPGGPYVPVDGGPLVCNETGGSGAIDPSVTIVAGAPYLYWKAAGGSTRQLFGVALTPDGVAFAGEPQHLLTASAGWQQGGIENPSMVDAGGAEWLIYSGAYWATGRYAMGYAQCDGPLGPCHERSTGGPWVASRNGALGPGGGAAFAGPDGLLRLAFHSWSGGPGYSSGGRRVMHIETIDFSASGPFIVDRPPQGAVAQVLVGPSGLSVEGFAADADTSEPIAVIVFLDGREVATTSARPLFSVDLPSPADGPHRVCVVAVDDLMQSRPQLGCQDFSISSVPFGSLDTASPNVTGWAIGPSTTDPIAVDIYVDGAYVGTTTADIPRAAVGAAWPAYGPAHGFSTTLPAAGPGSHTVCAYGVVPDNRPAPLLGCLPI